MTRISRWPKSGRLISSRTLADSREHAAVPIDPSVVAQADRVDHQGIAGPLGGRIPLPRRRRILGQRPSVREDLAVTGVHLVEHRQDVRFVNELEHMWEPVRVCRNCWAGSGCAGRLREVGARSVRVDHDGHKGSRRANVDTDVRHRREDRRRCRCRPTSSVPPLESLVVQLEKKAGSPSGIPSAGAATSTVRRLYAACRQRIPDRLPSWRASPPPPSRKRRQRRLSGK